MNGRNKKANPPTDVSFSHHEAEDAEGGCDQCSAASKRKKRAAKKEQTQQLQRHHHNASPVQSNPIQLNT